MRERPEIPLLGTRAAILAALAVYLVFSLAFWRLPGLEYDEAVFVNAALGDVDGTFVEWAVPAAGRRIPLMVMPYLGALKAWIYAPIFALFGPSVESVRLPVVLIGLATLGFTFLLARAMLGTKVAAVATLLLACDPTFVFSNRLDWGPAALSALLRTSALYLLWRWLQGAGRGRLAGACFLLGLGLWDKVIFAWFLAALALALPIAFGPKLRERLDLRSGIAALAAFLAGCAPLVAFNVARPLATFSGQAVVTREWQRDLPLRLQLFRDTLDGSAVGSVVNDSEPGTLASLSATPAFYMLVAALGIVGVLALRRRLREPRAIVFHLVLIVAILAFIYATAQGTGPHHVVMVYPFTQIVLAFVFCEAAARASMSLAKAAATASLALLLAAQLLVDVGYVRSFVEIGGRGKWSDSIYDLARFADQERGREFLLMDWGFSNPLLALTQGRIKKEEAFVPIAMVDGEDARMAAIHPYLIGCNNLFVFHMPRYETYPILRLFKRAAAAYDRVPRLVRVFHQRDGAPVYLVFQAQPSEVEAHLERGKFFWFREAEERDAQQGGAREGRRRASLAAALGYHWGSQPDDFAAYHFDAPRALEDVRLTLRYALEGTAPKRYWLLLDERPVASLFLDAGGGAGQDDADWKLHTVGLGNLRPGPHRIRLTPGEKSASVFLDYLYLAEGELRLRTDPLPPTRLLRSDPSEDSIAEQVVAVRDRTGVRLEISPAEIAGSGSVTIRVSGYEVPAIDVVYTLDGQTMPIIYGWKLDASYSATVPVGDTTPKGVYRVTAIRDARDDSPVAWVRVDAEARIR